MVRDLVREYPLSREGRRLFVVGVRTVLCDVRFMGCVLASVVDDAPIVRGPVHVPSKCFSMFGVGLFGYLVVRFSSLITVYRSLVFFGVSSLASSLDSPNFRIGPAPSPSCLKVEYV